MSAFAQLSTLAALSASQDAKAAAEGEARQRLAALLPHLPPFPASPGELQALQQAAAQDLAADLASDSGMAGRVRSKLARTLTLVNIAWFIGCILVVTAVRRHRGGYKEGRVRGLAQLVSSFHSEAVSGTVPPPSLGARPPKGRHPSCAAQQQSVAPHPSLPLCPQTQCATQGTSLFGLYAAALLALIPLPAYEAAGYAASLAILKRAAAARPSTAPHIALTGRQVLTRFVTGRQVLTCFFTGSQVACFFARHQVLTCREF